MRSRIAQGEDGAFEATRRVVRLLVLLGAVVTAYLVLSLFDHEARADVGSVDQSINHIGAADPVASVKDLSADARKAVPEPQLVIPKSTAPKPHPQRSHRPTIKMPEVHPPHVQTPKKIHPRSIRAGERVRRAQVQTSKLLQPSSDAARNAARAAVTLARTVVVRPKLSTAAQLPLLPQLSDLPLTAPASWRRLLDLPQAEIPASPQLPSWPQLSSSPELPDLPLTRTPVLIGTAALPSAPVPHQPLMRPVCPLPHASAFAPALGPSGGTKLPAAQPHSRTAPLPAPPSQPPDRSTTTEQARDSGGGNAPTLGTVSSSWRPEVAAIGRRLATDLIARGRTVRCAASPS